MSLPVAGFDLWKEGDKFGQTTKRRRRRRGSAKRSPNSVRSKGPPKGPWWGSTGRSTWKVLGVYEFVCIKMMHFIFNLKLHIKDGHLTQNTNFTIWYFSIMSLYSVWLKWAGIDNAEGVGRGNVLLKFEDLQGLTRWCPRSSFQKARRLFMWCDYSPWILKGVPSTPKKMKCLRHLSIVTE